ncbi:hypothetical protein [Ureibacillus aquaedulcis]|uniref:Uncharacterized protein n=1 Tax=Ureibacillus aquaedulcis TaxID=3058421 RepID=A0ABT8GLB0_9BACL|nr:hypothetical protein [Ureibacillus sp. BA0131]MDN4492154.1 hypothetical protein [Ureibacillus sp. BA0131]
MLKEAIFVSPEEDERVQFIMAELMKGKSREEVATSLEYKNFKSLDIYMRRRGYRYDNSLQNYVADIANNPIEISTSKASRVIQLLSEYPDQLELVCRKSNFKDMDELAAYMTSKNYKWDSEKQNYVKKSLIADESENNPIVESVSSITNKENANQQSNLIEFLPILNMLKNNENRLVELLMPYGKGATLPRFTIEGIPKSKTVQMVKRIFHSEISLK